MLVNRLDHLVLTVASIDATVSFDSRVLGMTAVIFGARRTALTFGANVCSIVDDDVRALVTELTDAWYCGRGPS